MKHPHRLCLVATLLLASTTAHADTKRVRHLFNPTPRAEMRELSTDRPDTTESPISVDAGHVQVEADLAVLIVDRDPASETTGYELLPMNLKAGLLTWMDLQLVVEPYHHVTVEAAGARTVDQGYGATTLRLKMNLWGNDGGPTALALMPFVSIVDDGADFGLIAPFAWELPAGFGLGLMLEADVVRLADSARGVELLSTMAIGRDVVGPLGAFAELALVTPTYGDAATLSVNGGLTVAIGDDVQLDTGVRGGAVGPLPDAEVFVGVSARR